MKKHIRTLAAAVVMALAPAVMAQTTTPPSELNKGQNLVATKIASNFTGIAGGEENALALVNALRTGGEVTLVTTVPPPSGSPPGTLPTTTETSFAVPTKPMGWGNVKHALALAQDQLARAGITDPTAAQLQTALMGGDLVVTNADGTTTTTSVKGVLTMRADGMGWGNIAKEGGTKLGPVTSKVDMSNKSLKTATATTTSTAAGTTAGTKRGVTTAAGTSAPATRGSKGITTAAGAAAPTTKGSKGITTAAGGSAGTNAGKGPSKGITTAQGASATHGSRGLVTAAGSSARANPSGHAYGRGIVTGAGGSATNVAAANHGRGGGNVSTGAGVVTGGGHAAGSGITHGGGNSNAGGNGKGGGNGNGKGKGG